MSDEIEGDPDAASPAIESEEAKRRAKLQELARRRAEDAPKRNQPAAGALDGDRRAMLRGLLSRGRGGEAGGSDDARGESQHGESGEGDGGEGGGRGRRGGGGRLARRGGGGGGGGGGGRLLGRLAGRGGGEAGAPGRSDGAGALGGSGGDLRGKFMRAAMQRRAGGQGGGGQGGGLGGGGQGGGLGGGDGSPRAGRLLRRLRERRGAGDGPPGAVATGETELAERVRLLEAELERLRGPGAASSPGAGDQPVRRRRRTAREGE